MQRIFVSRKIQLTKELTRVVKMWSAELADYSLLEFEAVPFDLPQATWLYFYSPRGVFFFLDKYPYSLIAGRFKIGCYGPGTAKEWRLGTGHQPDLIGTGKKDDTTKRVLEVVGNKPICFVSGTTSMRSIQEIGGTGLNYCDLAVYKNQSKKGVNLGFFDLALLTSPMNASAFIENHGTAKTYIALGQSTANALAAYNLRYSVCESPTESAIHQNIIDFLSKKE